MGRAAALAAAAAALALSCAPRTGAPPKYPARPANCKVTLFHANPPPLRAWDDLGPAEVGCHIDVPPSQCLQRLRAEACRMGGDFLYGVPTSPERPRDTALVFRGRVGHTQQPAPAAAAKTTAAETAPPEGAADPNAPVEPLFLQPPLPAARDGGGAD